MCLFYFKKIDLLFGHYNPPNRPTMKQIHGQGILLVIHALKRVRTLNRHSPKIGPTTVYFLYFGCKQRASNIIVKKSTDAQISFETSSMSSLIFYFKLFRTHTMGCSVERLDARVKTRPIRTEIVPSVKYIFSVWVASRLMFNHFSYDLQCRYTFMFD